MAKITKGFGHISKPKGGLMGGHIGGIHKPKGGLMGGHIGGMPKMSMGGIHKPSKMRKPKNMYHPR
jgi:hypothetical protein